MKGFGQFTYLGYSAVAETEGLAGFAGFVEYHDAETAASAVRNLNGFELENRGIRVDHAEPEKNSRRAANASASAAGGGGGPQSRMPMPPQAQQNQKMNLPQGTTLPPGVNATDAISQTLATIPPEQLLDIMSHMKVCFVCFIPYV